MPKISRYNDKQLPIKSSKSSYYEVKKLIYPIKLARKTIKALMSGKLQIKKNP